MVEIRGPKSAAYCVLLFGALHVVTGIIVAFDKDVSRIGSAVLFVCGVLWLYSGAHALVRKAPDLRATAEGLSFAGRTPVPWSRIKQIYPGSMKLHVQGMSGKTTTIAIDFIDKRTLLRQGPSVWLRSPFCVGDIDFGVANPSTTAAQLEALRVQAVGSEDGRIMDPAALPAARVIERRDQ
jgi:hypothetical protein